MKPLPMPIRVAAGLVATVLEEAEHLPRRLTELPVTAVSQALQHAMRVQQKVTDLAIKGDRALGSLRPVPETPTWARFDEDEEPDERNYDGDYRTDYDAGESFSPPYPVQTPKVTPVRILPDLEPDDRDDAEAFSAPPERTEPSRAAPKNGHKPATTESAPPESGPPGLDGYQDWSLPQLRARFRSLKPHQLQALLDWESAHQQRPPYLTMLSNRIASVTGR